MEACWRGICVTIECTFLTYKWWRKHYFKYLTVGQTFCNGTRYFIMKTTLHVKNCYHLMSSIDLSLKLKKYFSTKDEESFQFLLSTESVTILVSHLIKLLGYLFHVTKESSIFLWIYCFWFTELGSNIRIYDSYMKANIGIYEEKYLPTRHVILGTINFRKIIRYNHLKK